MENNRKKRSVGKYFALVWLRGLLGMIPTLLVSCILPIAIGEAFGTFGAACFSATFGAISAFIYKALVGYPKTFPDDIAGEKPGIPCKQFKRFLLPNLITCLPFLITLITLIFIFDSIIGSSIMAASFSHWLLYWFGLWLGDDKITCDKCHRAFTLEPIGISDYHQYTEECTKTHTGSGVIGTVYDDKGNKIGDVKGDTSYTTTHHYEHTTYDDVYRCRCCGEKKKIPQHSKRRLD